MNDNLEKFLDENLEEAFRARNKALAPSTKNTLDGYIQALQEVQEFIENDE